MKAIEKDLDLLFKYCSDVEVTIHPSVQPRRVEGCGLGVYATGRIGAGEQLVQVPTSQIFTTANIPDSSLDSDCRKGIAVHAQLAAFFAFGDPDDLEPYQPWMKTWPALEDFYETMPMFWGEWIIQQLRDDVKGSGMATFPLNGTSPVSKRRKIEKKSGDHRHKASKNGGCGLQVKSLSIVHEQVTEMVKKLVSHLMSISEALPHLNLLGEPDKIVKFLHAWCLINTRCFYYVPTLSSPGKGCKAKVKPPADPNEAMGLCPFMDLFNHTAPPIMRHSMGSSDPRSRPPQTPCTVRCNSAGFAATTTSEIEVGKEIMFSYGAHTNDTLWSEYGFLLPGWSNTSDSILLDNTVLGILSSQELHLLEGNGYLATYTLFNDGSVCYRTEMAVWLKVLGPRPWQTAVEEGLDPEDIGSQNGIQEDKGQLTRKRYCDVLKGWLVAMQDQAKEDMKLLRSMKDSEIQEGYETLSIVANAIRLSDESRVSLARMRHQMCLQRCEQVHGMASRGIEMAVAEASEDL